MSSSSDGTADVRASLADPLCRLEIDGGPGILPPVWVGSPIEDSPPDGTVLWYHYCMKFELFVPDASPKFFTVNEELLNNIPAEGELQRRLSIEKWLDTVDTYGHPYRVRADAVTHYSPVTNRSGMRTNR